MSGTIIRLASLYRRLAPTRDRCCWPCGDPKHQDFYYCGDVLSDGVYCAKHITLAHQHQVAPAIFVSHAEETAVVRA